MLVSLFRPTHTRAHVHTRAPKNVRTHADAPRMHTRSRTRSHTHTQLYSNNFCGDVPTELQALSSTIATNYRVTAGNDDLGTDCHPQPTLVPTTEPSPLPTSLPSPMPTTAAPTLAPTPVPTPATKAPTASPTPIPTSPSPSPAPTVLPTAYCGDGQEWNGAGCDSCGVGKYSNLTVGKYNVSSHVRACTLCPAGR